MPDGDEEDGATGGAVPNADNAANAARPEPGNDVTNANNVQNTSERLNDNINMRLEDGRTLIFNTLLTFCVSAMSNAVKMNVIQLIVMKFSDNEIISAKDTMCKHSDNLVQFQVRKDFP